jgi:sulfite reductase (NADPH) hemoprotein beta-component
MSKLASHTLSRSTLGTTRLGFADEHDLDLFVDELARFERGELSADEWKAFRLVNGVYGQRQADEMMVRVKIPQGILSPPQLRALADAAERYSGGRGHLTTRQNLQLNFVKLADVEKVLRLVADAGLTSREACGNTVRNVTTCPLAGASAAEPFDPTPWAEAVTRGLLRGSLSSSLPRKFKIAFGGCCGSVDCVGASFNDIGFFARLQDGKPGFRVTLGGGLATLRRAGILAHEFVPAEEVLEVSTAVVRVFNRTGDRKRRDKARLKFVVERLGAEAFLAEYRAERAAISSEGGLPAAPVSSAPPRQPRVWRTRPEAPGLAEFTRTNALSQKDPGLVTVLVRAPLGDLTSEQLRGLAALAEEFSEEGELRATVEQNLALRFVQRGALASLHAALAQLGLGLAGARTVADVTSCPGAFSCRLAVTTSRGMAFSIAEHLAAKPEVAARAEGLVIKISGCPNGCGQHHVAGIGLQGSVRKVGGKAAPHYQLHLGGSFGADTALFGRLSSRIPARRVPEAIERLIALYDREKTAGETPAGYFARVSLKQVDALLTDLALGVEDAKADDFVDLGETKAFEDQQLEGECAA